MARDADRDVLRPSLLDRLTEPRGVDRATDQSAISARELKESVLRDLVWLLNTRVWLPWDLTDMEETPKSMVAYGLPDLSRYTWTREADARTIAGLVEKAIRNFEPRLRSVRCELVPAEDVSDFAVRIRIDGILQVDPISEPVSFDTGVDIDGGRLHLESVE